MIIKSCHSFTITSFPLRVMLFYSALTVLFLSTTWANSVNKVSPGGVVNEARQNPDNQASVLFGGIVEPAETLRILLQPGETVKDYYVHEGAVVAQDQILVQLSSDALTNSKFDLLQKKNQLQQEKEQIDAAALEIKMKKKQLARINKEIQEESRLTSEVEGYISTISKQLINQKTVAANELEILEFKFDKMQLRDKQYDILNNIISDQLADIKNRMNNLLIKAPFPGKVIFLSPFGQRTPPGGIVCELWGTKAYRVRGRIMQHQIDQVKKGEPVEISLDFTDYPPLTGRVLWIKQSRMIQNEQGGYPTFDVIVEVVSKDLWLEPGMMVSMKKRTE